MAKAKKSANKQVAKKSKLIKAKTKQTKQTKPKKPTKAKSKVAKKTKGNNTIDASYPRKVHFDSSTAKKLSKTQKKNIKRAFQLPFHRTEELKINSKSRYNAALIIDNDTLLKDVFKFNDYTQSIDVAKDATDHRYLFLKAGEFKDDYPVEIAGYIEASNKYEVNFAKKLIDEAITIVAHRHHYNPVKDYFKEAYKDWDGKLRIYKFLPDYLGADQSLLNKHIMEKFLVAAIAKVYKPLTKWDYSLDLVGAQGVGKTTLAQKLAPLGYYTDQMDSFRQKDVDSLDVMEHSIIVNDDEMAATDHSSFEEIKKFMTAQKLQYRRKYGTAAQTYPKAFVMIRTTNNLYYLRDKTGDRRFLPVICHKEQQKKSPVTDLPDDYIKKLWGEAAHIYWDDMPKGKFSLKFNDDDKAGLNQVRSGVEFTDDLEDRLADMLENRFKDDNFIANSQIEEGLDINLAKNPKLSKKVKYLMANKFDFHPGTGRVSGQKQRGYRRQ